MILNNMDQTLGGKSEDPHQALLPELFSHVLYLLPPTSRANPNVVSRARRTEFLSNHSLQNEIDLSRLNLHHLLSSSSTELKLDERFLAAADILLHHYDRLSSLTSNRVVKLTIDLASFWRDFRTQPWGSARLSHFLTSLRKSEPSLREISITLIHLRTQDLDWEQRDVEEAEMEGEIGWEGEFAVVWRSLRESPAFDSMLVPLLEQICSFRNLERIWMKAPSVVSLKAGGLSAGLKSFNLTNTFGRFPEVDSNGRVRNKLIRMAEKICWKWNEGNRI